MIYVWTEQVVYNKFRTSWILTLMIILVFIRYIKKMILLKFCACLKSILITIIYQKALFITDFITAKKTLFCLKTDCFSFAKMDLSSLIPAITISLKVFILNNKKINQIWPHFYARKMI